MREGRRRDAVPGLMRDQLKAGMEALKQGDADSARDVFSTLLEADPGMAVAHVGLGRVFAAEGDHHKALEHFQEALAIKPDFASAQVFRAEALEQLGDTDEALIYYADAVKQDPSLGMGYQRMARLLNKVERNDEALALLQDAVRHNPQDVGLRLMLANTLNRNGQSEAAEAELKRVIEIKPDLWIAHYQIGKMRLREKKAEAAVESLNRAASSAPGQAAVHQALGTAHAMLGDNVRAARSFDEAYRLKPSNVRPAIKAALARSAAGRHREAQSTLNALSRTARRSSMVQRAQGDIYMDMDQPLEAAECYRAVILNSQKLGEIAPDLVTLAQQEMPKDAKDYAEALRKALDTQKNVFAEKARANPERVRSWRAARRERRAG